MVASADDIDAFTGITGASAAEAQHMIEMCGELENAVQLWFSDEDLQRTVRNAVMQSSSAASNLGANASSRSNRPSRNIGREDAQGVIHLDSDDDDVPMTDNDDFGDFDGSDDDAVNAASVARAAQEEEDARVARQLQEELYSGGGGSGGGVRAPMARTTETLVGPGGFAPGEDEDDAHAALLEQMRRRARASRPQPNPFSRSVWDDNNVQSGPARGAQAEPSSRASRLADLFRPPFDLISRLNFDEARDEGKDQQKWILVDLQDPSDFHCQALNRDIWKDESIKAMVKESFIFLQYDKDNKVDPNPEIFINRYLTHGQHENPANFPYVCVIDPRTGEQVKVWSRCPFYSASEFLTEVAEFLDRYSLDLNSKNPVPKKKAAQPVVDYSRLSEEEMLRIAMQNSLETTNGTGSHQAGVVDPDALTQSVGDLGAEDKGKGKAAQDSSTAAPVEESAFARIPSDKPHVEPEADPKTSTRVQIRYSGGRAIRRFLLDDKVQRIYEWLKAEPVDQDKKGVEFQLKTFPSSEDLIEKLDQTISEAKLANGTIGIEYIEDDDS
ncbi:hypothetical protein QBC35DRAFT_391088 [Podospora australis]|uniref:UBX domain-containing protein n=1 Tax=Podospora australis TaxID=1536484 RepID=A0AAN6WQV8_9PEZI|nr:hypothetical protein QBC35DRAFT_391088 [Podospora australis]